MIEINELKEKIRFEVDDFDSFGVTTFAVLREFQKVSTKHAEILGLGFHKMIEKKLLWVTMRIKFEIVRQPKENESLEIVTYPSGKNMLEYDRDYLILDENNEIVIKGTSKWCLIDSEKRRVVRLMDDLAPVLLNKIPLFEGRFLKSETFEPEFLPDMSYLISQDDIDNNNHTNNTIYAKIVDKLLKGENKKISFCQINFLKETRLRDRLDMFKKNAENKLEILGKICEGEVSFSAHIDFAKSK